MRWIARVLSAPFLQSWFEEVAPLPTTETGHTGAGAGDQQGPGAELGPHGAAAAAAGAGVGGRALGGAAAASGPRGGWLGVVGGGWSTSSVRVVNAGCPATSSAYMNLCLRVGVVTGGPHGWERGSYVWGLSHRSPLGVPDVNVWTLSLTSVQGWSKAYGDSLLVGPWEPALPQALFKM